MDGIGLEDWKIGLDWIGRLEDWKINGQMRLRSFPPIRVCSGCVVWCLGVYGSVQECARSWRVQGHEVRKARVCIFCGKINEVWKIGLDWKIGRLDWIGLEDWKVGRLENKWTDAARKLADVS